MNDPDLILCLECGRQFRALGSHLPRAHNMTASEYRAKHGLPASYRLAGRAIREAQSERTREMLADGRLRPEPAAATEAARTAGRGQRTADDLARQAEIARAIPQVMIPDSGKRADGRDAVKAREAQRRRRAAQAITAR